MGPQRLLVIVGMFAGMAAMCCSSPNDTEVLTSDPNFVGFVTAFDRGGTGEVIGRLAVESHADKLVQRHLVTLGKRTVLLWREGTEMRPADISSLKPKEWVKIWFSGTRKASYPVEVTARQLVIVDHP